ncbi:uncharacterized protein LOC125525463 [Triticum urartu]|nr:uncharacterized protein LOC125525463 [Triticum urartu]
MIFLASSSPCDAKLHPFVYNLTSSYTDQRNEVTMVFTSAVMFILATLFFTLNLFSRLSVLSAILNPSVRLFLSTSLSLFLPVMSYLFSEAKNEGSALAAISPNSSSYSQLGTELSLRARTILMWMLLVELLRKKVEAILVNAGVQWHSGTIDRASRIAWLGYLVFYNLSSTGKKAIYGTLWVLAAAKLLQRVSINELLKRSFAYGKNAELLSSYMAQMLQEKDQQAGNGNVQDEGAELLKKCKYAVMGEEELEMKPGPEGYCLELKKPSTVDTDTNTDSTIITVGDIWRLAEKDKDGVLQEDPSLKRLCLSFALYKLLRRRFEDLPITQEETSNCHSLIFRGLREELLQGTEVVLSTQRFDEERKEELKGMVVAVAVFEVFDEEIQFLCEYYHSVVPVVLSNPFFFLANYILFPIVVWAFCLLTFILCGNGDVRYAYHSIITDNYLISIGMMKIVGCLLGRIIQSPEALFTTVDLAITMLLLLTFLYEEVWEFLVFILSNWLMVSLVCEYTTKSRWRDSRILSGLIRRILWVRSKISRRNLCFNQFSMIGFGGLSPMMLPKKAVPMEVKKSIMKYLVAQINDGHAHAAPLSNGWSTLQSEKHRQSQYRSQLSLACESKSVTEVILIWHIATSLLDRNFPLQNKTSMGAHRKVAVTLSGYCAYLVASYPELLPDNKDGTTHVYKEMQEQLKNALGGCWRYHLSLPGTRYDKLVEISKEQEETTMVQMGAKLGDLLMKMAQKQEDVWGLLADLWTELMVYVAPSGGELHVKAHKEALAQGGEFITVLWALCTHTGITRPAIAPWEAQRHHALEP